MTIINLYYTVKGKEAVPAFNEAPRHEGTRRMWWGSLQTFLTSALGRMVVTYFTSCPFILTGERQYSSAVPKYSQYMIQQRDYIHCHRPILNLINCSYVRTSFRATDALYGGNQSLYTLRTLYAIHNYTT